jgi:hypothetical protein
MVGRTILGVCDLACVSENWRAALSWPTVAKLKATLTTRYSCPL